MTPSRAAIYARISDDAEGRAAGVARQVEDATALALRLGWMLAPLPPFIDNDISASTRSTARRPAYADLMARVARGEVDGIAYYSSSRLTRRPVEFEAVIRLVEQSGLMLASVVSGNADLSTADGRMIARILAAQDAAEAERIGERVRRAFAQRRAEGKPAPSSRAFGFEAGGVRIRDEEAALIRQAAVRIADEGWSLGQVCRDWNELGVPTLRGAPAWNTTQIRRALLSPRTAGLVAPQGPAGAFGSIISPELQQRVSAALSARRKGHAVTFDQRRNLLAGFLVCGRCGKPMRVNALLQEDGSLRSDSFVVCSRSQHGCGRVKRNLPMLMEYVDLAVRVRLETWQPVGDVEVDRGEEQRLRARLAELEEDATLARRAFEAGTMRFADYHGALSALRTQEDAAGGALAALLAPREGSSDLDAVAAWAYGSLADRRDALHVLVDHIRLLPMGRVGPAAARRLLPEFTSIAWRTDRLQSVDTRSTRS